MKEIFLKYSLHSIPFNPILSSQTGPNPNETKQKLQREAHNPKDTGQSPSRIIQKIV